MNSPLASFHISNGLTYASLLCGVGALCAAAQHSQAACGVLLAAAVVCDTFDGQFARRFRPSGGNGAEFGSELDSLVDAVTFGAAPVMCASVLFNAAGVLWWAAAFIYICCAVTRLGFYNLTARNAGQRPDFIGLPSPIAALFWSTTFLLEPGTALLAGVAVATGIAMIAPFRIPRPSPAGLLVFAMWPGALMVAHGAMLIVGR